MAEHQKSRWRDNVHKMCFAYNCTRNDSTGFSPFELLFGRKPRLPIGIIIGHTDIPTTMSYPEHTGLQLDMQPIVQLQGERTITRRFVAVI